MVKRDCAPWRSRSETAAGRCGLVPCAVARSRTRTSGTHTASRSTPTSRTRRQRRIVLFTELAAAVRECGDYRMHPTKSRVAFITRMSFAGATLRRRWIDVGFILPYRSASTRFRRIEDYGMKHEWAHTCASRRRRRSTRGPAMGVRCVPRGTAGVPVAAGQPRVGRISPSKDQNDRDARGSGNGLKPQASRAPLFVGALLADPGRPASAAARRPTRR